MDLELRRNLFRLIAGALFVDRRLEASEDLFLTRLCAELELSQAERQTLEPVTDSNQAKQAMRALPEQVRSAALERVIDAAVVDVTVGAAERRYLFALGEALDMSPAQVEARLADRGLSGPPSGTERAPVPRARADTGAITRVADVMTPDPMVVEPDVTVEGAYGTMKSLGFRHLPVVRGGKLVGIISTNDVGRLGATVPEIMARAVATVMTPNPFTIEPDEPIEKAAATMALRKVSCLPVMSAGALVGIVTTYDLLDALARRLRTGK